MEETCIYILNILDKGRLFQQVPNFLSNKYRHIYVFRLDMNNYTTADTNPIPEVIIISLQHLLICISTTTLKYGNYFLQALKIFNNFFHYIFIVSCSLEGSLTKLGHQRILEELGELGGVGEPNALVMMPRLRALWQKLGADIFQLFQNVVLIFSHKVFLPYT